ncbi:polysaccharide deacetylase family protein [Actinacidiphila sp. SB3-2]
MFVKGKRRPNGVAAVAGVGTALLGLVLGLAVQGEGHAGSVAEAPKPQQKARPATPPPPKPTARSISHETETGAAGKGAAGTGAAGTGTAGKSGKAVALTLDDGPHPVWTPKMLDLLDRYRIKATFCLIGPNAEKNPKLVRRIVADGHRLCNHSVSHDTAMDGKSVAYQEQEIRDAKRMIDKASGGAPLRYYRAPGGAFTPDSRAYAAKNGMRPLGWTADSDDWRLPGVDAIVNTVQREVGNGARIILTHDGGGDRAETYAALQRLLPSLREQGYSFTFPQA